MAKKKAVFNWSGGKDSALALRKVLIEDEFEIVSLLTSFDSESSKSIIHQVPLEVIKQQADQLGIPLKVISSSSGLKDYEAKMEEVIIEFKKQGVGHFIFGDIFLEDIRKYREDKLAPFDIEVIEPLWEMSSVEVIEEFLNSGLQTKIIVTMANKLGKAYIGKDLNKELLNSFPTDIDPCGENGEYHTLVYAGDIFQNPINFNITDIHKISYDFTLDNGEETTSTYWQAIIQA